MSASETAAIVFCVLLALLSIFQFAVIGILVARLKGIKVEDETKMYLLLMRDWLADRLRELREREGENHERSPSLDSNNQRDRSPSPEKVPDFPGVCNLPPTDSNCYSNTASTRSGSAPTPAPRRPPQPKTSITKDPRKPRTESSASSNQEQLIHSMAQLMKDGLKETAKDPRKDSVTTVRPPIASKPIVFASYDMANETGQIVEDQLLPAGTACDYEEPVPLNKTSGEVVLASYEVARDHAIVDDSYEMCSFVEEEPTATVAGERPPKYVNVNIQVHD